MNRKEELEKFMKDIKEIRENNREITIYQNCTSKGKVKRTPKDLKLCNKPVCLSCRMISLLLKAEATQYLAEHFPEDEKE